MSRQSVRIFLFGAVLALGAALALPSLAQPTEHELSVAVAGNGEPAKKAEEHDESHVPTLDEYNWFYGFFGEKEGVEPSFLYRPKGMPVPFGALLLNSGILYWLLIRFAKKPIAEALKSRKAVILRGMEEAGKMKSDAEARLADYEQKLAHIDQEIARVRQEMRATGQAERSRILAEAKEKRARMEREAQILLGQELKAARELLLAETARGALRSAETVLRGKLGAVEQARIAEEYLAGLKNAASALRGKV